MQPEKLTLKRKREKRKEDWLCLKHNRVGAHHFVVFVVNDVAVPNVAWSFGWVKRVFVDSWSWGAWS